jgi:hypothetical protein
VADTILVVLSQQTVSVPSERLHDLAVELRAIPGTLSARTKRSDSIATRRQHSSTR